MPNEEISLVIKQFIQKGIEMDLIDAMNEIYVRNRLLSYLELEEYITPNESDELPSLLDSMDRIIDYAVRQEIIEDYNYSKDIFEAKIMNLITPVPSIVNEEFWKRYEEDPKLATDYLYTLSQENNYIKTRNISKNIFFETTSSYGNLEITINLSKPEKDPKEITALTEATSSNYPKCALCLENEGYEGHTGHAARENHRVVRMDINDELYGMQYSPYVYYNEHSIFLNEVHKPMIINRGSINNLLTITDVFPHYFVGSNADLPIVGGSILTHDHYQGGRYTFPIEKAKEIQKVDLPNHPNISAAIVKWPLSVIRLQSENKTDMIAAVGHIMDLWEFYSDEEYNIRSHTDDIRHNTITPIARRKGDHYVMDIVLRNNRTNDQYPDGIFHPHSDVHHIKKENIGLIEVMGLAILPPRLVDELNAIEQYLLGDFELEDVSEIHQSWATELKEKSSTVNDDNVNDFIEQEVGNKFTRVLEDAGVYKQTSDGLKGFNRFIEALKSKE